MKNLSASLLILFLFVFSIAAQENSSFTYGIHPSIGFTYTNQSQDYNDSENMEWLLNIIANANYAGEKFQFDADAFIQFGQIVKAASHPSKTQDNFMLNLMPSIGIYQSPGVRLFWQTKIESQLKEGYLGDQKTEFFDPGFITHTLFVGNKNHLITQTEDQNFSIVYGMGYSFQQVIKQHFQLESENQPSSNAEYIDGPTAVFNITFSKKINELVSTNVSFNSLLLAKKNFLKQSSDSRFSSLLVTNLDIGIVSIQYTNRLVYDKGVSSKRQLDQSLVMGLKFSL